MTPVYEDKVIEDTDQSFIDDKTALLFTSH